MRDGSPALEAYLHDLHASLRGLDETGRLEIVAELRSHVLDSVGGDADEGAVAAVLGRLGSPAEIATLYRTDRLLERAGRGRSPWRLLWAMLHWASAGVAGAFALIPLVVGYVVAAAFVVGAVVKPLAPERVGLWRVSNDEFSLRLGLAAGPPPIGQELLGWWIVPLGLGLGGAALWLAVSFGRWAIDHRRASLALPR